MVYRLGQYNVPFQAVAAQPQAQSQTAPMTPMQGAVGDKVKEGVNDNPLMGFAFDMMGTTPQDALKIGVPLWLVMSKAMDAYNKKLSGDYSKSVMGRIENGTQSLINKFNESSAGKSRTVNFLNKSARNFKKFFNEKVVANSAILRAVKDTPSLPENKMVLSQAQGLNGFLMNDYTSLLDKHFLPTVKDAEDLVRYGAGKDFIKAVQMELAVPNADKARILQRAEFKALHPKLTDRALKTFDNLNDNLKSNVIEELKAKALGYKNRIAMNKVIKSSNIHELADDVIKACSNAKEGVFAGTGTPKGIPAKVKKYLFGRDVPISELRNKMLSSLGMKNPHKVAGVSKLLPTLHNWMIEASTGRFAGGKLSSLMQIFWLTGIIATAAKADGGMGEKTKTFIERFVELVGFFAFMPLSIKMMHKLGGMQYAGLTKEQVSAYRNAVIKFNAKADAAKFATRAEHKAAKSELKNMLKADVKNPFTRLGKRIGRIITTGLEQLRPFSKTVAERGRFLSFARLKDVARHPKYWFKQAAGWPIRFIIPMMIIMPFFSKLAVKASDKIFGRPKKSLLDKETTDAKSQETQQLTDAQKAELEKALKEEVKRRETTAKNDGPADLSSPTNYLNMFKTGQIPAPAPAPTAPKRTYVPSPESTLTADTHTQNSKADEAIKRAERAEAEAMKILGLK